MERDRAWAGVWFRIHPGFASGRATRKDRADERPGSPTRGSPETLQTLPITNTLMGDKSPKSVNKVSKQQQAKAATLDQRKKQALADQKAQGKKK